MKPYFQDDKITIYHGNAEEILPNIKGDLMLTDPPYGVDIDYFSYEDSEKNLSALIKNIIAPAIETVAPVSLITCGVLNIQKYPPYKWILSWSQRGAGSNPCGWGWSCWQPVLAYGTDPFLKNQLGSRPDEFFCASNQGETRRINHPVVKPLNVMRWLVYRGAPLSNSLIVDPFMGSGTTLRAAKDLGHRAIGIEIEERYCEVAANRMSQMVLTL